LLRISTFGLSYWVYKGIVMSMEPNCTRTLVKDLLFQRKYKLTDTQTMFISYLTILPNWAMHYGNGFYLLLSSKIESDLRYGLKTIEATITKLLKIGLIETKQVKVPNWNTNKNFRAIKLSEKGLEYNSTYIKPRELNRIEMLELERENLLKEISQLKKKLKIVDNKKPKDEVKTVDMGMLIPLIEQKILGNSGEVFRIHTIEPVVGGVEIRLENAKDFSLTYVEYNENRVIPPEIAMKWIVERRSAYQEREFKEAFRKITAFLHIVVFFKRREYMIKSIKREKNYRVSIDMELKNRDEADENIKERVKLEFNPPQAIEFLTKGVNSVP